MYASGCTISITLPCPSPAELTHVSAAGCAVTSLNPVRQVCLVCLVCVVCPASVFMNTGQVWCGTCRTVFTLSHVRLSTALSQASWPNLYNSFSGQPSDLPSSRRQCKESVLSLQLAFTCCNSSTECVCLLMATGLLPFEADVNG